MAGTHICVCVCAGELHSRSFGFHSPVVCSGSRCLAAMLSYPAQGDLEPGAWKTCHYEECGQVCGQRFGQFRSLVKHLQDFHQVTTDETKIHWLHTAMLRERRGGDEKKLGFMEYDCVGLAYLPDGAVDECRFQCKWCNNKVLSKTTCLKHMTQQHPLAKEEVHTWLTYSDGEKIRPVKKGKGERIPVERLYLTGAMHRHVVGDVIAEASIPEAASAAAVEEVPPKFWRPTPKLAARAHTDTPEVQMPAVKLTEAALAWTAEDLDPNRRRKTWPIAKAGELPLHEFKRFLKGGAVSDKTIGITIQGVEYFFSLLAVEGTGFSLTGALVTIYNDNITAALFDLPILDTEHSWTRKIVNAMSRLCTFLVLECGRLRWGEAARCIEQLSRESFSQRKKVLNKQKKLESIVKRQHDSERLAKLPPVATMKEAVRFAMVGLRFMSLHAMEMDTLPEKLHSAATAAMVGILWFNGFAGRSKEWELMTMDVVRATISSNLDYVACPIHKTAPTYGDLGKHLSPGTKDAIADYIELPRGGRDTGKFLRPGAKAKSGKASVHTCLRTFCAVYLPNYEVPGTTLIRKWYHSGIKNDQHKAMQLVARLDGHSHKIADTVYAVSTPQQDAERAKHLVDIMLGGPVGSLGPSDTENFCFEDVLQRWGLELEFERHTDPTDSVEGEPASPMPAPPSPSSSTSTSSSSSSSSSSSGSDSEEDEPAASSQPPLKQARAK